MKKDIKLKVIGFLSLLLVGTASISGCSILGSASFEDIKVSISAKVPTLDIPKDFTTDKLQVKVLKEGSGVKVGADDTVTLNVLGKLTDGTQFQSTWAVGKTSQYNMHGMITGWSEALVNKTVGSKLLVAVPPEKGYKDSTQGQIKPNSVLVYVLEIVKSKAPE